MPHHWIRISTGTPPELEGLADKPHSYEQAVADTVIDEGGNVDGIWFDLKDRYAYVLVQGSEGTNVASIARRLEGEVTDLESVPERVRRLRPSPEKPSAA